MHTLRDFLASRESELSDQIKALRAELAELKRAKAAIEQPEKEGGDSDEGDVRASPRLTIKEMIRSVLGQPEAVSGLAASEVLEGIERSFDVKLERTSLSPQLSRLRESGDVVSKDGRWFSSEPRLSQARAVTPQPSRAVHHSGGEAINAGRIAEEAVRLFGPSLISRSAAEEAAKLARQTFMTPEMVAKHTITSATLSSSAAVEAAVRASRFNGAAMTEAHSSTPHTMKTMEEADSKMRALLHGPDHREASRDRGSGPKTE